MWRALRLERLFAIRSLGQYIALSAWRGSCSVSSCCGACVCCFGGILHQSSVYQKVPQQQQLVWPWCILGLAAAPATLNLPNPISIAVKTLCAFVLCVHKVVPENCWLFAIQLLLAPETLEPPGRA